MWTTPRDLEAQLLRRWRRGELLRPIISGATAFPLRLSLQGPTSAEVTNRFEAVRHWAAALGAMPRIRLGWREVRHRVQGVQRLPSEVWVDSLADALALLGKHRDGERWARLVETTRGDIPALLPWLERRPLQALDLADSWDHLVAVVGWLLAQPRPGIYLRQVDVPGVHSKFIEDHRGVLSELLDLALPAEAVRTDRVGVAQFARRYGFLDKPTRIRFRVLDERIHVLPGAARPDIALDSESFARLELPVERVFITENETNFLAFPAAPAALVVFGAGYGWEALARARWLSRCALHYWGDIDTHGFAILDRLRGHFDPVSSFLMDRATLDEHRELWGEEPEPVTHELTRLTAEERALFEDLRHHRIRRNLRLEQERVGFRWVGRRLREAIDAVHPPT
jgi:hypothetical protein